MTNLMQQLQAWANRGAFKFPEGDDKGGFTMIKGDSNDGRVGVFSLTLEQTFGVQCVLDGTIQVWRPVEHYKPKTGLEGLGLVDGEIYTGTFVFFPTTDTLGFRKDNTESWLQHVAHWMPLPKPPKENNECN